MTETAVRTVAIRPFLQGSIDPVRNHIPDTLSKFLISQELGSRLAVPEHGSNYILYYKNVSQRVIVYC